MKKEDIHIILTSTTKKAFGDILLTSYFVSILNDNGVDAYFFRRGNGRVYAYMVIDCPKIEAINDKRLKKFPVLRLGYAHGKPGELGIPIISQYCKMFKDRYNIPIKNNFNYIPVKYYDMPEVPSVDVSLCTKSGGWSQDRDWPYFEQLKERLKQSKISYIDLNEEEKFNMECLNYIKKSKLYVGLETGTSHYASQVANGKTLILQSGIHDIGFWCSYDYDHLYIPVKCKLCKSLTKCPYDNKCMKDLTVDMMFNKIIEKL